MTARSDETAFSPRARGRAGRGIEQIALLTVGIVLGVLGFAASAFWYGAILVMAVLWGIQVATLRSSGQGTQDAPVIGALIQESRSFAHEVADSVHTATPETAVEPVATEMVTVISSDPPLTRPAADSPEETGTANAADLDGLTRQELYEMAKTADVPGRSGMTKDELRKALGR